MAIKGSEKSRATVSLLNLLTSLWSFWLWMQCVFIEPLGMFEVGGTFPTHKYLLAPNVGFPTKKFLFAKISISFLSLFRKIECLFRDISFIFSRNCPFREKKRKDLLTSRPTRKPATYKQGHTGPIHVHIHTFPKSNSEYLNIMNEECLDKHLVLYGTGL